MQDWRWLSLPLLSVCLLIMRKLSRRFFIVFFRLHDVWHDDARFFTWKLFDLHNLTGEKWAHFSVGNNGTHTICLPGRHREKLSSKFNVTLESEVSQSERAEPTFMLTWQDCCENTRLLNPDEIHSQLRISSNFHIPLERLHTRVDVVLLPP